VSGFKGYYIVSTDDGCVTVSLYDDKAGADESTRIARDWVQEHASELTASTPEVSSGEVLFHAG
jgi:hypothetical protein